MGLAASVARRTLKRTAAICRVVILCAAIMSSIWANSSSIALGQDDATLKPGMYWTLSSKWRWNGYGMGDHAGWRVEREDWNDTLSIQEVSSSRLSLGLKSVGQGALEASGSFIISGRRSDSWRIDRQYSLTVNATTFRGQDGKPIRWIVNVKGLSASGSVPEMWIDENYRYVEVQFPVSGHESVYAGGFRLDAWIASYRNLTVGYWSAAGNHSTGYKQETLNYEATYGFLLHAAYDGKYAMKTDEGGWNETETFVANTIDSNLKSFGSIENANLTSITFLTAALVAIAVIIIFTVFLNKRRGAKRGDRYGSPVENASERGF